MRMFHSDIYLMHGRGGGAPQYIHNDLQVMRTGGGLRSVFSTIFSNVVPFVKSALRIGTKVAKSNVGQELTKHLKRSAAEAGVAVVNDALKGKNVLQSSKQQVAKVAKSMSRKMESLDKAAVRNVNGSKKKKKKKRVSGLLVGRRRGQRGGKGVSVAKKKKKTGRMIAAGKKKKSGRKACRTDSNSPSKSLVPNGVHTLKDLWSP